jgi:hypothetical protein
MLLQFDADWFRQRIHVNYQSYRAIQTMEGLPALLTLPNRKIERGAFVFPITASRKSNTSRSIETTESHPTEIIAHIRPLPLP